MGTMGRGKDVVVDCIGALDGDVTDGYGEVIIGASLVGQWTNVMMMIIGIYRK
jgi:hypothetical protein